MANVLGVKFRSRRILNMFVVVLGRLLLCLVPVSNFLMLKLVGTFVFIGLGVRVAIILVLILFIRLIRKYILMIRRVIARSRRLFKIPMIGFVLKFRF